MPANPLHSNENLLQMLKNNQGLSCVVEIKQASIILYSSMEFTQCERFLDKNAAKVFSASALSEHIKAAGALENAQGSSVSQQSHKQNQKKQSQLCIAKHGLNIVDLLQALHALDLSDVLIEFALNPYASHFALTAIDLTMPANVKVEKAKIQEACAKHRLDIYQKRDLHLSDAGLLVMDMDSTVIAMECIDEIAGLAGVKDKVSQVTEAAMRGDIPFTQSLHERVACLEGIDAQQLYDIRKRLPFMPNFISVMKLLKAAGWRLAIASGGFTFFADFVKEVASLDYAMSNQLEIVNGKLTGKVLGEVVDANKKASILLELTQTLGLDRDKTIAMGDGANDLVMMQQAGHSLAYHAKRKVAEAADNAVYVGGFEGLIFTMRA
uniref:phosphoserine phosphatase SerB n=1 Tax=Ningiella ruwaisensis TaxID=2364274 RepID=UPI0019D5AA19|nr:phosphoserine phosphatase SerB [Ningiella ruwaisensis]